MAIFSCAKKLSVTEPVVSMSVAKDYTIKILIYGGNDSAILTTSKASEIQITHFDPSGNSYTSTVEAEYPSEDRDDTLYAVYNITALYGTVISIEAKPSEIHHFERFTGSLVSTSQKNTSFQVKGNGTISVYFTIDKYKSNKPYIDGNNYEIRTAIHLKWLGDYLAEEKNFYNKTITLMNDIDVSTLADPFVGIATANKNERFAGTFDGAGFTVSGINIDTATDYTGFIGALDKTGTIKNLKLSGNITGKDYTGSVVGYSEGNIENVESSVTVVGENYTGGIVGYIIGNVSDAKYSGSVTGEDYTAGIAGYLMGNISKSVSSGTVNGKHYSAGIAGYNKGNLSMVANNAVITGKNYTSGIAGYNYGSILNATNEGTITGDDLIGSIAGYSRGELRNVYNKLLGTVDGNEMVGGIAGYHFLGTLTEANNMAIVEGVLNVGGLVGNNAGTIIKADNSGQITATATALCNLGGLVGRNDGLIKDSFNTGTVRGNEAVGGISGINYGSIEDKTRNAGTIEGTDKVGGLIGINHGSLDNTSHNTGSVKKGGVAVGDLIGLNYSKTLNLNATFFNLRSVNVLPPIGKNAF